mmetsp:Transcript_22560/g.67663  ORF Transcript_22560/g.67663 Transcript_22560/m.67663 type:complete len:258 (-) Transcript_22560:39-812(-)
MPSTAASTSLGVAVAIAGTSWQGTCWMGAAASWAGASGSPRVRSGTSRLSTRVHFARAAARRAASEIPAPARAARDMTTLGFMMSIAGVCLLANGATSRAGWDLGARNLPLTGSTRSLMCTTEKGKPCSTARRQAGRYECPAKPFGTAGACWDTTVIEPGFWTLTVCRQRPSRQAVSDSVRLTAMPWSRKVSVRTSCTCRCICPSRPGNQDELLVHELEKLWTTVGRRNWPLPTMAEDAANARRSLPVMAAAGLACE